MTRATDSLIGQGKPPRSLAGDASQLICPADQADLRLEDDALRCAGCARTFSCERGIPSLFWPNNWDPPQSDVTEQVKAFYEACPFPNYDDLESSWSLREKADRSAFARLLNEQLPPGARILEVGCGTGQLSNFLGLAGGRTVLGTDLCLNSLALAEAFRARHGIDAVAFVQMNLFRPVFRPASFDVAICNGVLHHTSDPAAGFHAIAQLVKPGGLLLVGLYNRYGRVPTHVRRLLYRLTNGRGSWWEPRLRDQALSPARRQAWIADQYAHPHESCHTYDEVLGWFQRGGVAFLNSVPHPRPFEPFTPSERVFAPRPAGTRLDHLLVELGMLLGGGREGGFFIMIGRRTPGAVPQDRFR